MASWNFREAEQREEIAELKEQLAAKESKFAALEDQLFKKDEELWNIKESLDDLIPKLRAETSRNIDLEKELIKRQEELRNEKLAKSNLESALVIAQQHGKSESTEIKRLNIALEQLGKDIDGRRENEMKLKEDKMIMERKVEELRAEIRRLEFANRSSKLPVSSSRPQSRQGSRPRTSSLSNIRIVSLEHELQDERAALKTAQENLYSVQEELQKVKDELIRFENENTWLRQLQLNKENEFKKALDIKDQEIQDLREQGASLFDVQERERELLERIEQEEEKNALLEYELRQASLSNNTKEIASLKRQMEKLKETIESEARLRAEIEVREAALVQEREEALDRVQVLEGRERELAEQLSIMKSTQPQISKGPSSDDTDLDLKLQNMSFDEDCISKLLDAIERLRAERDSLRRDVDFLQLEARCAEDAWRKKHDDCEKELESLRMKTQTESSKLVAEEVQRLNVELETSRKQLNDFALIQDRWMHDSKALEAAKSEICRLGLAVTALSISMSHSVSENDMLKTRLVEQNAELDIQFEEFGRVIRERADTEERSRVVSRKVDELDAELERVRTELFDTIEKYKDLRDEQDAKIKLLSPSSVPLPSSPESDSETCADSDSQPSTPVSPSAQSELITALHTQINLLEARILRRTEQIGLHQHDIKRLETNLKLAEDRLSEMGGELDSMVMEREAMVEDCRIVREEREEAEKMYMSLQEEVDILTSKLADAENGGEAFEMEREEYKGLLIALQEEVDSLTSRLHNAEKVTGASEAEKEEYKISLILLQGEVDALKGQLCDAEEGAGAFDVEREEYLRSLHEKQADINTLQRQVDALQREVNEIEQAHSVETTSLVSVIVDKMSHSKNIASVLRSTLATLSRERTNNLQLIDDLQSLQAMYNGIKSDLELQQSGSGAISKELERRAEELASLQRNLENVLAEQKATEDNLLLARESLERNELVLREKEAEKLDLADRFGVLQEDSKAKDNEIVELKEAIVTVTQDHASNIERLNSEHGFEKEALEGQLQDLVKTSEIVQAQLKEVEDLLIHAAHDLDSSKIINDKLRDETEKLKATHTEEKADLEALIEELREALQEEQDSHQLQVASSEQDIQNALDKYEDSSKAAHELRLELSELEMKLKDTQSTAEALVAEKESLQSTNEILAAESHRTNLENRVIEKELESSRRQLVTASDELAQLRAKITAVESSGKATELNLDLLKVHHDKTVQSLRRQLQELEHQTPSLHQTVNELKEKNNEMEELLRSKTTEIEEYDDKFIALLKEKKKLTSKVETLTKKVQNLQKKIGGANENVTPPTNIQSSTKQLRHLATENIPPVPTFTPSPNLRNSIFAAPIPTISQLPRPATPEAKRLPLATVQAMTPESIRTPLMSNPFIPPSSSATSSGTSAGKKRRAPDDFDPVDPLPPQPIIAEKQSTPRKKPLQALRSGFTPVRGNASANARPLISHPSPLRRMTQSAQSTMAEITNSPRRVVSVQQKPQARTWLGKIRGGMADNNSKVYSGR